MAAPTRTAIIRDLAPSVEAALACAVAEGGTAVSGDAVARAWVAMNPGEPCPVEMTQKRWTRLMAPGIAANRISVLKRSRSVFFAPNGLAVGVPPMESAPRAYGAGLVKLGQMVAEAVRSAAGAQARMVSGAEAVVAWFDTHGCAPPVAVTKNFGRAAEPALASNDLYVQVLNGIAYYAPPDMGLLPPRFPSDLMKLEEGLRRAVAGRRSAVLIEAVYEAIECDPELQLQNPAIRASAVLELVRCGRAKRVSTQRGRGRNYYTFPGGPTWIRADAEHRLDRRWRGIEQMWRATGGLPFRTRALRRFSASRPGLFIPDDPKHGLTNALQHLAGIGVLTRLTVGTDRPARWASGPDRYVLWAPSREWDRLSEGERAARVAEVLATRIEPDSELPNEGVKALVLDPGRISQSNDLRALIAVAKQIRNARIADPHDAVVVDLRPVTAADVRAAKWARPDLAPGVGSVERALVDASRIRKGMRVASVCCVGRVGRTRFYDLEASDPGLAFVALLNIERRARRAKLSKAISDLRAVQELSVAGIIPMAADIQDARAKHIARSAKLLRARLSDARNDAPLLVAEIARVERSIVALAAVQADAMELQNGASRLEAAATSETESIMMTTNAVWDEVKELFAYRIRSPGQLAVQFASAVPSMPGPYIHTTPRGRRANTYLDRIAFACYAGMRWGGPLLSSFTARASNALGTLRNPAPYVASLLSENRSAQASAAAALGVFDDRRSRLAVAEFLSSIDYGNAVLPSNMSFAGLGCAIIALARSPFGGLADELAPAERDALITVADAKCVPPLSILAARVLQSWDEAWPQSRILFL